MAAITDLAAASSVGTGDYLVISQSGNDRKVTANKFAIISLTNMFTAAQTVTNTVNVLLELNRSSGSYAALKLSDPGGNITLNGGGGGFLVSSLAGTGTAALEATSIGVVQRSASDARLKKNVAPVEAGEALALVTALEPVRFRWIDTETRGDKQEIGLVAQQVAPYVPEVIGTNGDGMLSLDYPKLTALLIGAIQELTARVAALEAQVA